MMFWGGGCSMPIEGTGVPRSVWVKPCRNDRAPIRGLTVLLVVRVKTQRQSPRRARIGRRKRSAGGEGGEEKGGGRSATALPRGA
eukprot:894008-Heterocapsa_arctica.AAC.1